jgi:predicted GTPase
MLEGLEAVKGLKDGSKILMAEACTHSSTHEDIGRVKIPAKLREHTGKDLLFDFYTGHDFPANLKDYDLVVHCGACMINRRSVINRIAHCREHGVPITNYGVLLAFLSGVDTRRFRALF